jgi:hypothetical protein
VYENNKLDLHGAHSAQCRHSNGGCVVVRSEGALPEENL